MITTLQDKQGIIDLYNREKESKPRNQWEVRHSDEKFKVSAKQVNLSY